MQIVRLDKPFKQTGVINLENKFKDWNLGNDFFDKYQRFSSFTGAAKGATVKDGYLVLLYNENEKNENRYAVAKVDKNLNTSETKTFLTISKKDLSRYNLLRTFVSPDLSTVAIIAERNYDGKKQDLYYRGKEIWGLQKKVYIPY